VLARPRSVGQQSSQLAVESRNKVWARRWDRLGCRTVSHRFVRPSSRVYSLASLALSSSPQLLRCFFGRHEDSDVSCLQKKRMEMIL
jgi:hypothetical protein